MLKSRGSGVGKSDPLDDMIRSMIKHVMFLWLGVFVLIAVSQLSHKL